MAGAFPTLARPSVMIGQCCGYAGPKADVQSARELVYRSLDAADHAAVRRAALITWNRQSSILLMICHHSNTYGWEALDTCVLDGKHEW